MLQYIGARYIPIFYQNSLDPTSTEWEANVTYEPMTWVSLPNGHMYISKTTVPANAGDPANTPQYWLEAGQYNAYIQHLQDQINDMNDGSVTGSLQNQIDEMNDGNVSGSLQNQITTNANNISNMNDGTVTGSLQNQIDTMQDGSIVGSLQNQITSNDNDITNINTNLVNINNKLSEYDANDIIVIGDSYAIDATAGGISWATRIAQQFGNIVHLLVQGGTGFATNYISPTSPNWLSMLQNYANTLTTTEKSHVKQIMIAGGANDGNLLFDGTITTDQLNAKIQEFFTYAASVFPNARIKLAFIGWHRQSQRFQYYRNVSQIYQAWACQMPHATYFANAEPIMHNRSYINATDMVHPTQTASNRLWFAIAAMLLDGDYEFNEVFTPSLVKKSDIYSITNVTECYVSYKGMRCHVNWLGSYSNNTYINVTLVSGGNKNINTGDAFEIATVENLPTGGGHPVFYPVHCICGIHGGSTTEIYGLISIQNGAITYKHVSNNVSISNMLIPWGSLEIPLELN